jgi:hypothetical protein
MYEEAQMSKYIPYALGFLVGLLILVSISAASALDSDQAEPESFEVGGRACIFYRGQLDCSCPCPTDECTASNAATFAQTRVVTVPQVITVNVIQRVPADLTLAPEEDPAPTVSTEPVEDDDVEERVPVTSEERDSDRDSNPADDRPRCNQGVGNGSEGCDPGNSNHNQPSNDENGGQPGAPGRAHNDNSKPKNK